MLCDSIYIHSGKCKLVCGDGKQVSGYLVWCGRAGGITKSTSQLLGMMDIILTVMIASQGYTYVKMHQTVH